MNRIARMWIIAVAVCVVLAGGSVANASILGQLLTFDGPEDNTTFVGGGEDVLNDESLTKFVDIDSSGGFSVGDVVFGYLTISDVDQSGGGHLNLPPEQLAIVFSAQVTGASGNIYTLDAIPQASTYSLTNLLDSDIDSVAGLTDDSLFVALGNSSTITGGANNNDPAMFTGDAAAQVGQFTNAIGWNWELTGGILAGDFFTFNDQFATLGLAFERAGFSVQSFVDDPSSVLVWLPVDIADFGGTVTEHDLIYTAVVTPLAPGSTWTFNNDSEIVANAVPEPASLALWLGLSVIGLVGGRYRRRNG